MVNKDGPGAVTLIGHGIELNKLFILGSSTSADKTSYFYWKPSFRKGRRARKDDVAAGLFHFFELEKVPLLGFEQQVVEGAKAVGALIETRMLPLDRFFHQRGADRIIVTPFRA